MKRPLHSQPLPGAVRPGVITPAHPKWNSLGTARLIHALQPSELSVIVVVTVITKGISNDKPSRVKALEAKEQSDAAQGWEAFS